MNRNRYRLVFNTSLGMMVPVAETARRRVKSGGGAAAGPALAMLLAATPALAELPVPCAGGACGVNVNPTAFVTQGAANYAINGNQGIVTQTTGKAIVNWQSYNLGAGNAMLYRYQDAAGNLPAGANFSTLNRIWQGSPSEIAGRIQVQPGQNGQIYLYNQNGILFKDGAQVNVGSLVASTLDIDDKLFIDGIPSNVNSDTLAAFNAPAGSAGGLVRVDAGATLKTENGGRVMLLAENVENHGLIETPEGQTILAAGAKVYLAVSDDPNLRGFLVEVDNGGTAANTGRILAERGNVSMTGLAVNQSGRITATTSVNLSGSIRLMARDTVASFTPLPRPGEDTRAIPLGTRTGTLVLGANSTTEVLPDISRKQVGKLLTEALLVENKVVKKTGLGASELYDLVSSALKHNEGKQILIERVGEDMATLSMQLGEQAVALTDAIVEGYLTGNSGFSDTLTALADHPVLEQHFENVLSRGANTGSARVIKLFDEVFDTLTDEQVFNRSRIEGVGKTVHVQGGAVVRATSGVIDLSAQAGQLFQNAGDPKVDDVRLQVDDGAVLDTAGLADVAVAVERNYIEVELRGSQLADSPLQRNTFLNKSKVWIDAEKGTSLADVSADIAKLERTVAEKSAVGGNIALRSEGDLVLQRGATLDVSGGSLAYQAGYGRTTKLSLNGKIVDIGNADPEQLYTGFADRYSVYDPKWNQTRTFDFGQARYIAAYTAGRDAGKLSLTAHNMVVDATLRGEAQAGPYQRAQAPSAGQLALTLLAANSTPVAALPDLSFVTARTGTGATGIGDALPAQVSLSTEFLSQGGFGKLTVNSKGRITLPADVTLDAGDKGSVSLTGRRLDIDGDILAAGGKIALTTAVSQDKETADAADFGLNIGSAARLDVAGRWINDLPGSGPATNTGPVTIDGGEISLAAHSDLTLVTGSVLDASGGAWVKPNGTLSTGDAGSIDLASGSFGQQNSTDPLISNITMNGELRGYGMENGGSLSVTASSIHMGAQPAGRPGELVLDEGFFGQGGFREFNLTGVDGVVVADGFKLRPAPLSAQLAPGFSIKASGSDMAALTTLLALPADYRAPTRVSLTASNFFRGDVHVGEGASIRVDPEGEVVLSANHQLTVLGTVEAAAGRIALTQPELQDAEKEVANFEPGRSIFLGANSRLLATGYYRAEPDAQNLRKGEVLDGGSVVIAADKGYLVTQAGSQIDVSGTQATLDIVGANGLTATPVGSNGGSIELAAREGMLLEGALHGHAGGSQAQGGSLSVALVRTGKDWFIPAGHPLEIPLNSQRVVTLQAAPTTLTAGMTAGDALDTASLNGQARLAQSQVQAGGFADLSLKGQHRIAFADALDLNLAGRLSLYAPNLSAVDATQTSLSAASAIIGNPDANAQAETLRNDASGGAGALTVNAGLIELVGHSNLQGFGETRLVSQGDIRVRSVVYDADLGTQQEDVDYVYRGSLATGGNLDLAARQVYPASLAEYALEIHNNPSGRITVTSTGSDTPVLSAGGKLSLAAPFIEQRGSLKAPFGEIALRSETITRVTNAFDNRGLPTGLNPVTLTRTATANGEVLLAPGSLTSVSAEGQLIPLGLTELSGRDWIYDFGTFKKVLTTAPEKQIVLDGDTVTQAAGARIDLSGGGDLTAYEFLKGPGGSRDILLPENSEGLYAVLPGLDNNFAAYDHQTYKGLENWNPGASVRLLEGTQGLAAGNYTLLPARYALLPGAYLVRVRTQASDQIPGRVATLPNGATWVAGYLGTRTASGEVVHGARTSTIEIRPGSVARQYSEFADSFASRTFASVAGAQLPGDAGRLSIGVGSNLTLLGDLLAGFASGQRGPEVDISADRLAVTSTGASYGAGYVTLSVDQLDNLDAASLLLGGSRSADGDRVQLTQRSNEVVIANDADHALAAPEVILAARDTVKLENGAVVAGEGEFSGQGKDIFVTDASGNADGALLRVSTGDQIALTRASVNRTGGVLDVAAGATVHAGKAAILDATLDNRTLGQVELPASGGALTLGATRISLVENGTPVVTGGLVFDQDRLADLGNPAELLLRSYSTLDVYGNVNLGGSGLASLGIEAAGLAGMGAAGETATLQADTVRFANPDDIDAATAFAGTPGAGDLTMLARNVELGKGDFTLRGFDQVNLTASDQVSGQGGSFKTEASAGAAGDVVLNASRITVAAGADQTIEAAGMLATAQPSTLATLPAAEPGGRLQLAGASVTHGGRIEMPAGIVELRAATGDVTLLSGSEILAGGASVDFADTRAYAAGGAVNLVAAQGKVDAQTGSRINVAGDSSGGDAGELTVRAADDAILAGTLQGDAANGFDSGRFELTARRVNPDANGDNDFSALNTTLENGGFHAARRIRVREGDIALATTDSVKAHEFLLSADQGAIRVAGTVDASGGKGGRIGLYAGGDLDLQAGAKLLANATDTLAAAKGTAGEGGLVELGSGDSGVLNLAAGSQIDVSVPTGSAARGGRVVLRAARTGAGAGTGVALGARQGQIAGAERVEVEAYKVYDGDGSGVTDLIAGTSVGNQLGLASVQADNDAFVAAVDLVALKGALDTGAAGVHLRPGVEVRNPVEAGVANSGDITLAADWNLNSLRHGGEAGVLTVRAGGNLDLTASLSDGFSSAATSGLLQTSLATWSYRLAAGADSAAADPLAIQHGASGNLNLAAGKLLRTGSGDIDLAAAGDVLLGSGAALYSAGYNTPAVADFTLSGLSGSAFPTGGGDVRIRAGGAVVSEAGPSGLLTDWLYRQGNTNTPSGLQFRDPGWWPQIAQFKNGVAALGGGDVAIEASGRVANLLVATVTNARQPASFGQMVDASRQVIQGGGDLAVRAGGDIEGGLFFVDRGIGRIKTGGAVVEGLARTNQAVGTVLALGDASVDMSARRGVGLESVINSGLVPQSSGNLGGVGGSNRESYFVTYGADSAARLLSVAGDTVLKNDLSDLTGLSGAYGLNSAFAGGLGLYPGTLEAVALLGDLVIEEGFTLMPSAVGDLRLLAGRSVEKLGGKPIDLSDRSLAAFPALSNPVRSSSSVGSLVILPVRESDAHDPELIHQADTRPVYVVARAGDIVGQPSPQVFANLAKPGVFQAGGDIRDVTVVGQNLRPGDVTRFLADRDIVFATVRDPISGAIASGSEARIAIGGPGGVEVIAGRDIDLGASQGVISRGNLGNPYLPEGGADLLFVAGAAARDANGNAQPIDAALKNPQAVDHLFAELLASAEASKTDKDYSQGEAAIAALFPTGTTAAPLHYEGDISLFFSQAKTEQGGTIQMLAPGGGVNAGLASVTGFSRAAADLGIITVQGGDIQAYTRDNFQVNSSRVFTVSGGDILLWSAKGDIDAGKGAKTASATPPPQLRIDSKGNFVLDVSQSISGSGIGALDADSNVVLIAPTGEVNAGDAGIRAGGNLTIGADRVVGADNIQVGGISAGVPISNSGAAAAAATGAGNVGSEASSATSALSQNLADAVRAAEDMKNAFKPTFITAEVVGHGE
ncbi:filamentous haemagglutinin family protein [Thiobacillus sp.]